MTTGVRDHQLELDLEQQRNRDAAADKAPETAPAAVDPHNAPRPRRDSVATCAPAAAELEPRLALEKVPTYMQPSLPWRERLMHFTFAWYTLTMSTSGIALILAITPHRFPGLSYIGLVIFILDLVFFAIISIALVLRFVLYKPTVRRVFTHPTEALFIPTLFLSVAAILTNIKQYTALFLPANAGPASPSLSGFLRVTFWIYLAVTFAFSIIQYHLLFTVKAERRLTLGAMTPAWILPIFPVMLTGTLAGSFSDTQPADQALAIDCAGLAAQGLGILVSVFFFATYLHRLMAYGLPVQRPGMFIAVGPPSFTCAALVAIAADVPRIFAALYPSPSSPSYSAAAAAPTTAVIASALAGLGDTDTLAAGIQLLALSAAVFLWGLSFWFFASASAAVAAAGMPDARFHLSWWSFVFPNVGFCIATVRIGAALHSDGVLWLASVMTALLFLAWLVIGYRCVRAVYRREIVWPGHDEDSD
ncbi:voltage-dependent anion channel-domain-containing protein [Lasiosphaeria ovina]|uniref:Voltage-dependent anion channel-domain-containing protein n=1 Tax=Lasiosphaeria ovina TaxID=92902 RepID=A0AAE0MYN1_9PEZI|nr:voltage-dependent anion channel-domain-containing protein [Lasiosphaeria ovina]